MKDWEPISRVHGDRFGLIQPANTLIQANIIGDEYFVEMEAEPLLLSYPRFGRFSHQSLGAHT